MESSRRTFIFTSLGAASALLISRPAFSSGAAARLAETDPTAQTMHYVADATTVDKSRNPNYVAGQDCRNCRLYGGKATDAWAPCPVFGAKQVAGRGWCSVYNKKT
ncbi:high-potential iron-sulfur protein [Paraburkholderia sp. HP33-1]|uniref:high-potential iron-sulfur protein n=1 Tax=Paraburkholderia sp. HP33-1 TaxID=2883243 RepID=UPI001F2EC6AF|nr:high-potential iron-sulfur protein [Paraburkholderia sp. HP33-1]